MSLTAKITPWDLSIPRSLALVKYIQSAIDLAIEVYRSHPQGLAHIVLTNEEYEQRYPNADGTPVVIPAVLTDPVDLEPGASAVDIANYERHQKKVDNQRAAITHIENQVEQGYPEDIRLSIEMNFSLNHLTLKEQLQELKRLNPLSDYDLKWLKSSISLPFPANGNIAAFTGKQLAAIAHLERLGQPLAPIDAIEKMFIAHQHNDEDREDYRHFLINYQLKFAINERTVKNYVKEIILFVNNVLPDLRKTNRATRIDLNTANSASVIPLLPNKGIMETELSANSNNIVAAATKQKAKTHASTVSSTLPPGFPPYWCWSHQNAKTHWSHNCKYPKEGHQRHATKENPMGAKNS